MIEAMPKKLLGVEGAVTAPFRGSIALFMAIPLLATLVVPRRWQAAVRPAAAAPYGMGSSGDPPPSSPPVGPQTPAYPPPPLHPAATPAPAVDSPVSGAPM